MIYNLGRVVPIFKGDYNSATTYTFLDVVFYDNSSFVALDTTTGNLPTDTEHWLPVALKGTTHNPTPAQMQEIISTVETYITTNTIVDEFTSSDTDKSLSANKGKELFECVDTFRMYGNGSTYVRHKNTPIKQNHKYRITLKYPNIDTTGTTNYKFYIGLYENIDDTNSQFASYSTNTVPSTYEFVAGKNGYLNVYMKAATNALQVFTVEDITNTEKALNVAGFLGDIDYTVVYPEYTNIEGKSVVGADGSIIDTEGTILAKVNVSGYNKIRFLAYKKTSTSSSSGGYGFYNSSELSSSTCVSSSVWKTVSVAGAYEYYLDIPTGATYFAVASQNVNNTVNLLNFYVILEKGTNFEDFTNEKVSEQVSTLDIKAESNGDDGDLTITDEFDNILVKFKDGHIITKNFDSSNITPVSSYKSIKLLMIGNSYSLDNIAYVPWLLSSIDDTIDFEFAVAKYSGCSLQQHYGFISENSAVYDFVHIKKGDSAWTTATSKTFSYILNYADWDMITLQQNSTNSPVISTYQPYLDDIIDLLFANGKNYKLGWLFTQASADYSGRFPDETLDPNGDYQTSDDMYNGIASCVQTVMATEPISFVIPAGTAIQNARQNATLDAIGNYAPTGHSEANGQLTYDGYHLQEGLPSLISAYATTLTIINLLSKERGLFGNTIRPTDTWRTGKGIPGAHGNSVGVSDSNCRIAQKCALLAINNPFEITENIN